jgi:hypothetical protein
MGVGVTSLRFLEPCAKGADLPACGDMNYKNAFGRGTTPAPLTDQDAGAELTGIMVRTTFATDRVENSFNQMGTKSGIASASGTGGDSFVDFNRGPAPVMT